MNLITRLRTLGTAKVAPEQSLPDVASSIAIIMDGNGRWARRRKLPVAAGHRAGTKALRRTVEAAIDLGVESVCVFAFSTENWSRPPDEVDALMDGIGDTIRISLTADPVEEVKVAWEILKALGLRERGPVMIACPSCGRDNVGVWNLAEAVEERLKTYPQAFEVAVMGCAVNGPGEAGDADFGIAGGRDTGFIYAHGQVLKKVSSDILVDELFHEIDTWIEGGMERPKRLKLAKPAALLMAEAAQRPS